VSDRGADGGAGPRPRQAGRVAVLASRSGPPGRALAGLAGTALGVAVVVVAGPGARPALVAAALLLSLGAFAILLSALHQGPERPDRAGRGAGLSVRVVLAAGVALTALCVALPPAGSKDVASYALYGRVLTEYGENPYVVVPDDHPEDPWHPDVSTRWRQTPSVYGPAFTVLSAAITGLGGDHRTLVRVLFQASAGLALVAAALVVARLTGDAAATAFVALNPVLLASVVNGAHNDALVGAALLGACLAARRRWWVAAGGLLALGAGVKVAAVLAVPALAGWAWRHGGRRAAAAVALTAGGLLAAGHLAFGPVAVGRALAEAGEQHSRSSVWRLAFSATGADRLVGLAAIATSIVLGAVLARRHLADRTPDLAVASALVGYLLLGSYVLPWYHAWLLLPAAVAWRSRLALGSAAVSAVLLLGYTWQPGDGGPVAAVLREVSHWAAPAAALALAVVLARTRGRDPDRGADSGIDPAPPGPAVRT